MVHGVDTVRNFPNPGRGGDVANSTFRRTIPRRTAHLSSNDRNSKNGPVPGSFGLILPQSCGQAAAATGTAAFDNHQLSTHSHYQAFIEQNGKIGLDRSEEHTSELQS